MYEIDLLGFFPLGIPKHVVDMCETGEACIVDCDMFSPVVWFKNVQQEDSQKFLQFCYDIIGCNLIDHAYYSVNGHPYCFIVDDEGLFVDNPIVSVYRQDGTELSPLLVGNVLVCADDVQGDGYNVSFPQEQLEAFCQKVLEFPFEPLQFFIVAD